MLTQEQCKIGVLYKMPYQSGYYLATRREDTPNIRFSYVYINANGEIQGQYSKNTSGSFSFIENRIVEATTNADFDLFKIVFPGFNSNSSSTEPLLYN